MTTAGSRWGVVMSRNAGFSDQVLLLPNLRIVGLFKLLLFFLFYTAICCLLKTISWVLLVLYGIDYSRLWSLIFCTQVKAFIVDGKVVIG